MSHSAGQRVIRLAPPRGWIGLRLGEIWSSRELIWLLAMRDIRVRYKQTVLGVGWAVLVPFIHMVVFTLIVAVLFGFSAPEGIPFPLYNFAALVPWLFFSQSVSRCTSSLVSRSALIKKVYLPRIAIPLSAVVAGLVDFLLAFVLLLLMLAVFDWMGPLSIGKTDFPDFEWRLTPSLLLVVPMLGLAVLTATGVGLWGSALMVRFRDVGLVMPFLLQIWMYACPIIYSMEMLPESVRWFYQLNPMVGVIEGFRWALLGVGRPPIWPTLIATGISGLILISGVCFFRRTEATIADIL